MTAKIKRNDTVLVLRGKDRGKTAKVRFVYPRNGTAIVEGINKVKRHLKASANLRQAGIVERESPVRLSNVMLICSKCSKPTRVGSKLLEDGKKVRICRNCQEQIE